MKELEDKILEKGIVLPGDVLKVGSFLNNMIDIKLAINMADEFYEYFKEKNITKILTIEASGIGISCLTAARFSCDVVFAKKSKTINVSGDVYVSNAYSYTHQRNNTVIVPKDYLRTDDNVLIIDDFLATGEATNALIDIVQQSGAKIAGIGIEIEKGFQEGGKRLRENNIDLYSLAIIEKMDNGKIIFRKNNK